jgi:hypothetical protein
MKFAYIAAVAMTLVSAVAFTGCEKKEPTLGERLEQASKEADKAAADANKAADAAAKDANNALKGLKK